MPPLPRERFVLLFCHGGGLHKGVWTPIIRRLQAATLLHSVACDYVAFDWRYHATSACKDDPATLFYEENDPHRPRVDHPGMLWPQWAPEQLSAVLKELKSEDEELIRTTKVVGVGHSMGANALLHHEVLYPGSFEALVLFEPVLTYECRLFGGAKWVMDMLVKATLTREDKWCGVILGVFDPIVTELC
jgi:pimeloyl-ACP methyl ester carboxylesterase